MFLFLFLFCVFVLSILLWPAVPYIPINLPLRHQWSKILLWTIFCKHYSAESVFLCCLPETLRVCPWPCLCAYGAGKWDPITRGHSRCMRRRILMPGVNARTQSCRIRALIGAQKIRPNLTRACIVSVQARPEPNHCSSFGPEPCFKTWISGGGPLTLL